MLRISYLMFINVTDTAKDVINKNLNNLQQPQNIFSQQ
jgi:hypothetical protein